MVRHAYSRVAPGGRAQFTPPELSVKQPLAVLVCALAVAALGGCTARASTTRVTAADGPHVISPATGSGIGIIITQNGCGGGWSADGGTRTFQIHNADTQTTEVDLIDPSTGGVYGEVESLAPGVTRPMDVRLGKGRYAFRCYAEDRDAANGPTVTVRSGVGSPAVKPASTVDLAGAIKTYDAYVAGGVVVLQRDVTTLDTVVRGGDRAQAEVAWLTAHLDYNRLGAAYDAFGDYADEIDGTPDGLPGGLHDKDFTGFHRIEYGLWHGESMTSLAAQTHTLVSDVGGLRADLPQEQIDPNDMPLRAHEIMENTLEFQLSGVADMGSGTSLATAYANVQGTQRVLNAIAPVIRPRYTGWPKVGTWLATMRSALLSVRRPDGSFTPVNQLSQAQHERIDAAAGGLLEALAPIAAIGDVRRTS